MGIVRMGPPQELVLALRDRMGLSHFVETGTFRGDTAAWAAAHFARVTTLELSPAIHATARARLAPLAQVRALQGDSGLLLRDLVKTLEGPALFWLDAHWSGLDTAGVGAECPVLAEIALVDASPLPNVLLVDDARLFCAPPPRPHRAEQWPELAGVVAALAAGGRRFVVLLDDVLVAVPESERAFLVPWLQDRATEAAARQGGLRGLVRRVLRG
jgi:hypothetical protein